MTKIQNVKKNISLDIPDKKNRIKFPTQMTVFVAIAILRFGYTKNE